MSKDNVVKFNVECTMRVSYAKAFLMMLNHMEYFGNIGASRELKFYADGDGAFRPTFVVDDKPISEWPLPKPNPEQKEFFFDGDDYI